MKARRAGISLRGFSPENYLPMPACDLPLKYADCINFLMTQRMKRTLLASSAVLVVGAAIYVNFFNPRMPSIEAGFEDPGYCEDYIPVSDVRLIAHAGGGLPSGTYTNSLEAINMAAEHGFDLIELDFILDNGQLALGHDLDRKSDLNLAELMTWLDQHPNISIITDVKDGNEHLAQLARIAGGRRQRFIVQIYDPAEWQSVKALGFDRMIFTAYRTTGLDWIEQVNALELEAVTMPAAWGERVTGIEHPVFRHTVNRPYQADGLYTDCLIPAPAA